MLQQRKEMHTGNKRFFAAMQYSEVNIIKQQNWNMWENSLDDDKENTPQEISLTDNF